MYLLGESFGGLMSLALAERLGELVDRLVRAGAAGGAAAAGGEGCSGPPCRARGSGHCVADSRCWRSVDRAMLPAYPPPQPTAAPLLQPHPCVPPCQVLVNPATSFAKTPWPQAGPLLTALPPELYRLLPFALSPVLCDPLAMARNAVDERAPLQNQASDYLYGLLGLLPQLAALKIVLPPETLAWRLVRRRRRARGGGPPPGQPRAWRRLEIAPARLPRASALASALPSR